MKQRAPASLRGRALAGARSASCILLLAWTGIAAALSCRYVLEADGALRNENPRVHDAVFVGRVAHQSRVIDEERCADFRRECRHPECQRPCAEFSVGPFILQRYHFDVTRTWGATGRDGSAEIVSFQDGRGDRHFRPGDTYLVFANFDEQGRLRSNQCRSWAGELPGAEAVLARVVEQLGPGTRVELPH